MELSRTQNAAIATGVGTATSLGLLVMTSRQAPRIPLTAGMTAGVALGAAVASLVGVAGARYADAHLDDATHGPKLMQQAGGAFMPGAIVGAAGLLTGLHFVGSRSALLSQHAPIVGVSMLLAAGVAALPAGLTLAALGE